LKEKLKTIEMQKVLSPPKPLPVHIQPVQRFQKPTAMLRRFSVEKCEDDESEGGSCASDDEECDGDIPSIEGEGGEAIPDSVPGSSEVPVPAPTVEVTDEERAAVLFTQKKYEVDFTKLPSMLDKRFKKLDEDAALRATVIKTGPVWNKTSTPGLITTTPVPSTLEGPQQDEEKKKAFDLLDSLTRSGALPIGQSTFHVILAATHCFDKTLMDTLIQENINPIEKVERSMLIIASTIHAKPARDLIKDEHQGRVSTSSPQLFIEG